MNVSTYLYLAPLLLGGIAAIPMLMCLSTSLSAPSRHRTKAEVCLLVSGITVGFLTIYGRFLIEHAYFAYWDVGSDTVEQYVPFYVNLIEGIRSGNASLWNFSFGLGSSALNYQSWLLDPFNLVLIPLCLAFGTEHISIALALVQGVKILTSGLLFDHLLTRYCEMPLARLLGSMLFAFGGYLILWGQHYWLGGAYVLCVLITLCIELLLERRTAPRILGVALVTAICLIWSVYCGFMVLLFAAAYTLLRIPMHLGKRLSTRTYLAVLLRVFLPVVSGCLIACVTLVPYATFLVTESSRITGSSTPLGQRILADVTAFAPASWIPTLASRLLGNSLITAGQDFPAGLIVPTASFPSVNVYEFVMGGFSCGILMLLGQFAHWAWTDAGKRNKVVIALATLLVALYCVNDFLPALSNVFVAPKYRSSFALAIPLCLAISVGWERRVMPKAINMPLLAACLAITLACVTWSLLHTVDGRVLCLAYIAASLLSATMLVLWSTGPRDRRRGELVCLLALLVIVGSSQLDAFFSTNNRVVSLREDFPLATEPNKASDTEAVLAEIRAQDDSFYRIDKTYSDWTRASDGFIQRYSSVSTYNSTLDADVEEMLTRLWPEVQAQSGAVTTLVNDPAQPEMLRATGVRYLLSRSPLSFDWLELVAHEGSVWGYRVKDSNVIAISGSVTSEREVDELTTPNERRRALESSIIVPDSIAAALSNAPATDARATSSSLVLESASQLDGSYSSSGSGFACLAIPHTSGWKLYVDGKQVETFRANYGFIGFETSAGTHTIEARYVPEGLTLGCSLTAAGAVLLAVLCIASKRMDASGN